MVSIDVPGPNSAPAGVQAGMAWALLSAALFSAMVATFKLVGSGLPVVEILFLRQLMVVVVVAPGLARGFPGSLSALRSAAPGLQVLRVVLSAFAMLTGFVAVVNLPLADSTTIGFTRVLFTALMAAAILGETVGRLRWLAVALGLAGVVLVAGAEGVWDVYALLALLASLSAAAVTIILKRLSAVDGSRTIMLWHSAGLLVLMAVPAALVWHTPTLEDLALIALLGVLMSGSQWTAIAALRAADASAVAPAEYTRLLWAGLLGFLLFGHVPAPEAAAGAALIVGAAVLANWRSRLDKKG